MKKSTLTGLSIIVVAILVCIVAHVLGGDWFVVEVGCIAAIVSAFTAMVVGNLISDEMVEAHQPDIDAIELQILRDVPSYQRADHLRQLRDIHTKLDQILLVRGEENV